MPRTTGRRDNAVLDAVEAIPPTAYSGTVWRAVAEGRDPLVCGRPGGRWDDGTFDVLYTSLDREGSQAEMYFHLKRGQPVFPSKIRYELYELRITLERSLRFVDVSALMAFGVSPTAYGRLSYEERDVEYPRTQEIGEVAHFLDYDGLIVPNARWPCQNVVLFGDRSPPEHREIVQRHGLIDWKAWEAIMQSREA